MTAPGPRPSSLERAARGSLTALGAGLLLPAVVGSALGLGAVTLTGASWWVGTSGHRENGALGVLALLTAALLVWMARASLPLAWRAVWKTSTPLASLAPGEVLLEGVLEAEATVPDASYRRCALVDVAATTGWHEEIDGKRVRRGGSSSGLVIGRGLTVRGPGGSCRLELPADGVTLLAPATHQRFEASEVEGLRRRCPGHAAIIPQRPEVALTERAVVDGDRVLVVGLASEDREAPSDDYRRGAERAFVVGPWPGQRLLLVRGGRASLLASTLVPLVSAIAFAVSSLWLVAQAWSLWQAVR